MPGFVYLIRLARPVGRCLYYLGSTNDISCRWKEHLAGRGSPLLREALRRCIVFEIIAVQVFKRIQDARAYESRLKRWKNNRLTLRILPPWGVVGEVAT
jgi:predicted GIY-YIG superfamily endonuclease